ncbi:hypothetical protein Tco_0472791 [Tanacetum coccineum]
MLKKGRDEKDNDQDLSAGSDRGTKRRKSSKEAESYRDLKSKESKSSSSSKGTSSSQHKSSGKSAQAEDPSHTIDDSRVRHNQEFDTGNNDEQLADKTAPKVDWFKKPDRPPTPDPDWPKRQYVDFRPPQTWISKAARAEEPPTSFDELMDTPFDFSAFSHTELEYHFEECFKATNERLDWHNPKGKQYPFALRKPLLLIQDHQGRQVIPKDYFINNNLEYPKGPKRQRFYGFASKRTSSKDVYSRKRIIAVTRLKIMKWYDYNRLDEIQVRRDDQQLYTFKEEHHSDTHVFTMKMEILPVSTSKSTAIAGNPIKEILLKLNLLDHRSILTDLKVLLWLFKDYSYSTLTQGYCEGQDMEPLPPRDQRHPWLWSVNRVHILDFAGLTEEMRQTLAVRLRMVYTRDDGQELFTSHAWRRLFEVRGPLVREFILEFFSTCRMSDIEMDLDAVDTLCFQLGGVRRRMT